MSDSQSSHNSRGLSHGSNDVNGEVFVVGMARTPIGAFQGSLSSFKAPELGAKAIKEALARSSLKPELVNEVIMGNVLTAGVGQAPARQASIYAGIPNTAHALTINKVCGSGMKALMLSMQSIRLGDSDIVVAGGMESMSQSPYLMPKEARSGFRMGHQKLIDSMINDGLWDPYGDKHMGNCAELCAREKNFSRADQDAYAIESFKRAQNAMKSGHFAGEIVSVEVAGKKETVKFMEDEGPMKAQFDKIPSLKPAFEKDGSVTAANSSTINDGAAAFVLASASAVKKHGLKPIAKLVSYGTNSHAPEWFTTAPAEAMRRAMKMAGWGIDAKGVDLFEVNEAFAVVAMAAMKELEIPHSKFNIYGGAIALGHPIGASGARIVMTLISALKQTGGKRGVAGICIGGGEGTSICVEC